MKRDLRPKPPVWLVIISSLVVVATNWWITFISAGFPSIYPNYGNLALAAGVVAINTILMQRNTMWVLLICVGIATGVWGLLIDSWAIVGYAWAVILGMLIAGLVLEIFGPTTQWQPIFGGAALVLCVLSIIIIVERGLNKFGNSNSDDVLVLFTHILGLGLYILAFSIMTFPVGAVWPRLAVAGLCLVSIVFYPYPGLFWAIGLLIGTGIERVHHDWRLEE